jgi:hypothetical protein
MSMHKDSRVLFVFMVIFVSIAVLMSYTVGERIALGSAINIPINIINSDSNTSYDMKVFDSNTHVIVITHARH